MRRKNGQGYRPAKMSPEEFKYKRKIYMGKYRKKSTAYREWLHKYIKTPKAKKYRYAQHKLWYHTRGGKEHMQKYEKSRRMEIRTRIHKVPVEYFDNKLVEQNGKCAICGAPFDMKQLRFIVIDHDHVTGKVRGLLCRWCNWGLGQFKDNCFALKSAVKYLKKYKSNKGGA
jgi:hypothetical protein